MNSEHMRDVDDFENDYKHLESVLEDLKKDEMIWRNKIKDLEGRMKNIDLVMNKIRNDKKKDEKALQLLQDKIKVENEKHLTRKSKLEIEKNSLHEDVEKLDNNIAAIEDKFHVDGEFDYEMDELESALKDLTRERDSIKDEIDKLEFEKKKNHELYEKLKKKNSSCWRYF